MSTSADFRALDNCYALMYSYGEICVNCNCCGRFEKGLPMWKARIAFHMNELDKQRNFNFWFENDTELFAIQKQNQKANIKYQLTKLRYCKRVIRRLNKKEL